MLPPDTFHLLVAALLQHETGSAKCVTYERVLDGGRLARQGNPDRAQHARQHTQQLEMFRSVLQHMHLCQYLLESMPNPSTARTQAGIIIILLMS